MSIDLTALSDSELEQLANELQAELARRRAKTKVKVYVPIIGDSRYKQWTKILDRVDTSKANGYAFEGTFVHLRAFIEVPIGTWFLAYGEMGSRRHATPVVALYRAGEHGLVKVAEYNTLPDIGWALKIRDEVATLVKFA